MAKSVGELKALGEVGQAVSSTLDLQTVLSTIVGHAVQLSGTDSGVIYEYDEGKQEFHLQGHHRGTRTGRSLFGQLRYDLGKGPLGGRQHRAPVQVLTYGGAGTRGHAVRPIARASRISISSRGSAFARGANHGRLDGLAKGRRATSRQRS